MATGLLGDSWDDPRTSMMLALASGLLGGRGNLAQNLGAGLQAALPAYQSAVRMRDASELHKAQMEKYRADALRAQAMAAKGINPDDPSDIRTWREFEKMTPEQKANFILSKRSDFALKDIEGVLNRVSLSGLGGITPIEDLQRKGEAENFLAAMKSRGTEQEKANFDLVTGWNPATRRLESLPRSTQVGPLPPLVSPGSMPPPQRGQFPSGYMDPEEQKRAWRQFGNSILPGDRMQPVPAPNQMAQLSLPAQSPRLEPQEQGKRDDSKVDELSKYENIETQIKLARDLLPIATNSGVGSVIDKAAGIVGYTPRGAEAADQLRVIGGWLTSNVPRMEGPQSNYDVQQYREMAAQVANDQIPYPRRLAALSSLETLIRKYKTVKDEVRTGMTSRSPAASDASSLRKDAEDAIARGAPRDAVAKRFREQTGQDL